MCALGVEHIVETMRPLRCEPLPDVPAFVRGASLVRGRPTPVVDLRALLGVPDDVPPSRLVSVRTAGAERIGLLVDEVLGIRPAQSLPPGELPLLAGAAVEFVEALTRLDDHLLTVLRTGRLVPASVWERLRELAP
jgi:purine-binding chemotaxis protein CheW